VLDINSGVRTVEFTGTGAEVNVFLAELVGVARILELARSGTAALEPGRAVLAPSA